MRLSDELLCVFSARIQQRDDRYVIEVPEHEVSLGELSDGNVYRVGLFPADGGRQSSRPETPQRFDSKTQEPPVAEGETLEVEIEDIGDQGDGIARIDSGYVVFVPDTTLNERVTVEITDARETMAFAEVIGRQDR